MNLLTLLLICFMNTLTEEDFVTIRKVHFKKNNFSAADQKKLENGNKKEALFNIAILEETERDMFDSDQDHTRNIFSSESGDPVNIESDGKTMRKILSLYESYLVNEIFLNRNYVLTKGLIRDTYDFQMLNRDKVVLTTYQLVEETSTKINETLIIDNELERRIYHIKDVLRKIFSTEVLNLDEYIAAIDKNGFKHTKKILNSGKMFRLFYFENYIKCFKSLRNFVKIVGSSNLNWEDICKPLIQKFSKDFKNLPQFNKLNKELSEKNDIIDGKHIKEFLLDKSPEFIDEYFKSCLKNLQDSKKIMTQIVNVFNDLLKICYIFVKNQMVQNIVFSPLYGDYDINYYFDKIYHLIYKIAMSYGREYNATTTDHELVIEKMINELDDNLKKFQGDLTEDLCNAEYFQKCFSELFRRDISTLDNYIEVDNIVCDFNNMFAFISNVARRINDESCDLLSFYRPNPEKIHDSKISSGIEIVFNDQTKFKEIKAFDDEGKKISMMKNGKFPIDRIETLYFTSEVIKKLNIQEIEIIFSDDKPSNKIKVEDFLSE